MASTANKGSRAPGRTALSGKTKQTIATPDGGRDGLAITELSHLGKINLRGGEDILPAVKKHTGCSNLPENNRTVQIGERTLIWLAPDEFLVLCEAGEEAGLHSQLMLDLGKVHAAVTNVTDALCALSLRGQALRKVLAKGCALDLHQSVFTAGMCAQTLLASASITLLCEGDSSFRIICRTSFLDYVMAWLKDAACEYGYYVTPQGNI